MFQSSPGWLQKRWTLTARWRISAVLWGEHALVEFEQESGESLDSGFSYRFLTGRNMNGGVAWGSEVHFSHNYQPLPANFSNSHSFHGEKAKEYCPSELSDQRWEAVTISFIWVFPYFMEEQVCWKTSFHINMINILQPSPWPGGTCCSWAANGWLPGWTIETQAVQWGEGGIFISDDHFRPQVESWFIKIQWL